MDLVALGPCLRPQVTAPTRRPFRRITGALRAMTGRLTRGGRARWAGNGGRARPGPRCCSTVSPWARLVGVGCRQPGPRAAHVSLLAGAAGVVTKAGQHPDGRARVCARRYGTPGPGGSCLALARVSGQARRSFPRRVEPVVRRDAAQAASQANKPPPPAPAQGRPGRPTGRQNQDQAAVTLPPAVVRSPRRLDAVRPRIAPVLPLPSLGLDGPVGPHHAWRLVHPCQGPRRSTRRSASAFSLPYEGPEAGRGPPRTDGRTLASRRLPAPSRQATPVEPPIQTRVYQAPLRPTACAPWLTVVSIVQTSLHPHAHAQVIRCSRARARADDTLRAYDSRRCQLECHVRDANQDGGGKTS